MDVQRSSKATSHQEVRTRPRAGRQEGAVAGCALRGRERIPKEACRAPGEATTEGPPGP